MAKTSEAPSPFLLTDLIDDCLIHICRQLDMCDLFVLRDTDPRFIYAAETVYKENDSKALWTFDYRQFMKDKRDLCDLPKILDYFGHCMTRIKIDLWIVGHVERSHIPSAFLFERLRNIRWMWADGYYAQMLPDEQFRKVILPTNNNLEIIFSLPKLEALTLSAIEDIDSLMRLKFLKKLTLRRKVRIDELCEAVEAIPTLTHIDTWYDIDELDEGALERLIAKRQLSPYCDNQLLVIENSKLKRPICDNIRRNEKYVSCYYKTSD